MRDIGQPEWLPLTGEQFVASMDECGIDRAQLVQTYVTYHFDNSYMIDCALRRPQRYLSVCVIDQLDPGAPDLLSGLVENHGVRRLRMMGARGPGSLKDLRSFPLWERAQQLRIPICVGARTRARPGISSASSSTRSARSGSCGDRTIPRTGTAMAA